jgi:hypothetical protein
MNAQNSENSELQHAAIYFADVDVSLKKSIAESGFWSSHGLPFPNPGKVRVADKLPRIARTDICRGIIAQFMPLISGTRLGHYAVLSLLGAGGMGDPGGNVIGLYQHPA